MATRLKNRKVEFTGQLSEKKLSEIMGISTIVISPSLSDSIPLTAFEAMSCGSILVASDIPAHRQWETYDHPIFFFDKEKVAKPLWNLAGGRAEEPEVLGPPRRRGHVRDVRLRHGDAAARAVGKPGLLPVPRSKDAAG